MFVNVSKDYFYGSSIKKMDLTKGSKHPMPPTVNMINILYNKNIILYIDNKKPRLDLLDFFETSFWSDSKAFSLGKECGQS